MAHLVKRIPRGTTEKVDAYAGPSGELVMDTTTNDLVLETGVAGGVRLAKASTVIAATNGVEISAGGTLASGATVSGVNATTSAKGVVQLESATNSASETTAATPKAVSDALQAAKDYADSKVETYTGTAPIAVNASNEISRSAATQSAAGSMSAADKTKLDGIVDMTGAGASTAGAHGLVPAPAAGDNAKFLKGDGTWAAAGETYTAAAPLSIDANNEISISAATTTDAGSMSAADKTKLDGITTMTGATSVAAGASGLVPAPAAGDDTAFLKGDGTWGTPPGKTYTATAPVAIDANDDISVADATTSSKGVVQVGDNVTVSSGTISVKPWADYAAASSSVTVSDLQENAIVVTDEPVGGSAEAVLAEVEQTLSNSAGSVPSSAVVSSLARNVGELVHSIVPLTDAGLHLLDGTELQDNGVYAQGIAKIKALQTNYPGLFTTEADWQASVTAHGVCGKFVIGTGTLRLPKITGFMEGTIDPTALGDLVEAGLPEITGTLNGIAAIKTASTGTGALDFANKAGTALASSTTTTSGKGVIDLDASRSSSIYGNSQTVQPQSIRGFIYIVLAHYAKTPVQANLDNIATDLNNRATVDLANITPSALAAIAHAAMPSTVTKELTIPTSNGQEYTMPADGYLTFKGNATASGGYLYLRNGDDLNILEAISIAAATGNGIFVTIAVSAGSKIQTYYGNVTLGYLIFRYCNGNAHLAS